MVRFQPKIYAKYVLRWPLSFETFLSKKKAGYFIGQLSFNGVRPFGPILSFLRIFYQPASRWDTLVVLLPLCGETSAYTSTQKNHYFVHYH